MPKICIGFHLRHVFDTSAPSVGLNNGSGDKAKEIINRNKKFGLQTLNHVLDTLYYDSDKKDERSSKSKKPTKLCIQIDFDNKVEPNKADNGCHVFDRKPNGDDNNKDNSGWLNCHYSILENHIFDNDREYIKDFVSGVVKLPWEKSNNPSIANKHSLFEDYICGSEKLCDDLEIAHSLSAYRVITAALYQLGTYATQENEIIKTELLFGPQTITLIIRSESPFSVVIGATIIARYINKNIIQISRKFLEAQWDKFTNGDVLSTLFSPSEDKKVTQAEIVKCIWGQDWGSLKASSFESHPMACYLRELISGADPDTNSWEKNPSILEKTLAAFVDTSRNFVGERLEGKPVCFGFILGNPGLLTHTPREQPFPLEYYESSKGIYKFFTQEELPKQVHLVSMPAERAVVLPYCGPPDFSGPSGRLAAFALEFDEAMEEFRAYPWFRLWSDQFIPYLYYTKRFPWAIASYVGPGAEIRIFVGGYLVAYHYEKGWLTISFDGAEECLHRQTKVDNIVVRRLLQVALQMSRFSNPDAKGGMLIYLARKPTKILKNKNGPLFQSLRDNEPVRAEDSKDLWLTGRDLIRVKKTFSYENNIAKARYEYELDYAVARTLLQAAHLDGAIVLYRGKSENAETNKCPVKVHLFGQRINTTQKESDSGPKSGTRHAAAEALMQEKDIPRGSIAIAISSDGPISIWARLKDKEFGDPIKIGIPLDNEKTYYKK